MNIDHLVTMANQIGRFFASYPDSEEGRLEIANHLQRYWAPSMRRQLFQHIDTDRGAGLDTLVLQALVEHRREHMAPPPAGGDAG